MYITSERDSVEQQAYLRQFTLRTPVQLRFNDVDPLNHVNNAVHQELYDLGRLDFLKRYFSPIPRWDVVSVVIVHLELDFYHGLLLESTPSVATRIIDYDAKRVRMEQLLLEETTAQDANPRVFSRCDTLMVAYDARTDHSTELLPQWREQLAGLLGSSGRE